jgi:ABC-type amino acid transport substrate-binding protein
MTPRSTALAAALLLGAAFDLATAQAASLAAVRERGSVNVCANPDALPYSSQDRAHPGFQLEIADAIARRLGVGLHVDWIVFTRHARRVDCDAIIGSIVALDPGDKAARPGQRLTKPYTGSGYVLVVPPAAAGVRRLEELKGGKIGVEHTSWPHYTLDTRGIPTSSYGSAVDILEAVAKGEVAGGFVTDAYVGWYLKLHPNEPLRIATSYVPERDFRWNVAVGLRNADPALVDALNQAIDALIADRTIPEIFAKYGIAYTPPISR